MNENEITKQEGSRFAPFGVNYYSGDVQELIKVLQTLPPGARVACDPWTFNLSLSNSDMEQIGYIEVRERGIEIDRWDQEHDNSTESN